MTEREKCIKGLECCTQHGSMCGCDCNGHWGWTDGSHTGMELLGEYRTKCPYGNCETGCVKTLTKDALALLKAQEPRVLTLRELAFYDAGIFVETRNGYLEGLTDELWPALGYLYCVSQNGEDGYVSLVNGNAEIYDFKAKDYNVEFRCWSSRPTDEQRKAAKWGD